jgi:hypothetical protein
MGGTESRQGAKITSGPDEGITHRTAESGAGANRRWAGAHVNQGQKGAFPHQREHLCRHKPEWRKSAPSVEDTLGGQVASADSGNSLGCFALMTRAGTGEVKWPGPDHVGSCGQ